MAARRGHDAFMFWAINKHFVDCLGNKNAIVIKRECRMLNVSQLRGNCLTLTVSANVQIEFEMR